MKTCTKCQKTAPLDRFQWCKDTRLKAGGRLSSWCRECLCEKAKVEQQARKAVMYPQQKAWREANKAQWNAVMAAVSKRRHSAKLQRVPGWYDHARAQDVYDLAAEFREAGFAVDVDHIFPLQGEAVSGLHWHGNLRVCLATANRRKKAQISPFHGPLAI